MERTKKRNDVDEDGFRTAADAYAENSDVFGATITSGTNHSAGHQVASTQINENEGFLETMEMRIMEEALRMGGIAFSSNEPYTSFVPSDKAISKFMEGKWNPRISSPEEMFKVLLYHTVKGKMSSKDILNLKKIRTLEGKEVTIDRSSGGKINGAEIVDADIEVGKGIIHVIDEVLIPENPDA